MQHLSPEDHFTLAMYRQAELRACADAARWPAELPLIAQPSPAARLGQLLARLRRRAQPAATDAPSASIASDPAV